MAVHLDHPTRAALASAAADLRARAGALAVSWVAPENLHVTLKFLGGIDDTRVPAFVNCLQTAAARHAAFDVEIRGLGAFPSPTRPRVLWAGVEAGRASLTALAGAVDDALAGLGIARDEREFSPHVTVGRVRTPGRAPELADALRDGEARNFGRIEVREIALMRSELSPRGARYSVLAAAPLAGR